MSTFTTKSLVTLTITVIIVAVLTGCPPTPNNIGVPDVVGITQTRAESAIISAGLSVGTVTEQYSDSVPAGQIISQNPAAGANVAPNSAVALVVSKGPESEHEYDFTAECSGGGSGTQEDPFIICTIEELQAIGDSVTGVRAHYRLGRDIDAAVTASWNDGAGFIPIAYYGEGETLHFTGSFDGAGYVICNLYINCSEAGDVGLFGGIGKGALLQNIGLRDCDVTATVTAIYDRVTVGGLAGYSDGAWVRDCYVTGAVTAVSTNPSFIGFCHAVGGLLGENFLASVRDCYAATAVTGGGHFGGGLVGYDVCGSVTDCYARGDVTGGFGYLGGLVGFTSAGNYGLNSTVSGCYATGAVTGDGNVGGLVGGAHGTVADCWAMGAVTGDGNVGGLVGYNGEPPTGGGDVTDCYATGAVTGGGNVGGLVGYNESGLVTDCWATGAVTGKGVGHIGGLMGVNLSGVANCYATGAVTGDGDIGGLVGYITVGLTNCYATGAVTGDGNVGGLVGSSWEGRARNCYAAGAVAGDGNVGGLIGHDNDGEYKAIACFWDVTTSGMATSAGGIDAVGLTTSEMIQRSAFVNADWDFTSVWSITQGATYPWLRTLDYSEVGYPTP